MDSMVPVFLRVGESLPRAHKLLGVSLALSATAFERFRVVVKRVNPILSKHAEKVQLKQFSFALALPVANGLPIPGNSDVADALKTFIGIVGFASIVQKIPKAICSTAQGQLLHLCVYNLFLQSRRTRFGYFPETCRVWFDSLAGKCR